MAALVPDEKCCVYLDNTYFFLFTNAAGYYPRPVAPSTADVAPLAINDLKLTTAYGSFFKSSSFRFCFVSLSLFFSEAVLLHILLAKPQS